MKYLLLDSGPLINFALNGLLPTLGKLKKEFNGEFIITKEVKKEVIDYPLTIKRFELESLQINKLFIQGTIKHADLTDEQIEELRRIREEIINTANSTFFANGNPVHILDKGEAATMALSKILTDSIIVIDERTARMLCENPENIRKLLQKKLHTNIIAKKESYSYFSNFKVIRSTELAYLAFKKKLIDLEDKRALEATLYALKYKGCSISEQEIDQIKILQ